MEGCFWKYKIIKRDQQTLAESSEPLSYFMPVVTCYDPWKQETSGFLMFSGGVARVQLNEMR